MKTVLVTGCSSGIGLCAAQILSKRGHRVFATARKQRDVEKLASMGLESFPLDLADSGSIKNAVDTVMKKCGGAPYALFNNGAYGQPGAVEDLTRAAIREQFETNVFGTMELTNLVIPAMRARGEGRIVMNSSVLGLVAAPMRGAYNASKFALEGFTDTLRLELWGSGIKVSLIEPGPIYTNFRENSYEAFKKHIVPAQSHHRQTYRKMEERLTSEGPGMSGTLPPEAVVEKLIHAVESGRPKIRYYVTRVTYGAALAKRILPSVVMDELLRRRI
ncbi:MAG: SDR family NAD(P)-dependent oxidoreductase [Nitrospinae bacterium]|nr:SDR family NAD(P)-dependent oxidoreductase [Nitrospinota bacterium]